MVHCKILLLTVFIILGFSNAYKRIVGGDEAPIELLPYQASLQYINYGVVHQCGASIISTRVLLTVAHCNPGPTIYSFYARVGTSNYKSGGQLLRIRTFIPHPEFDLYTLDYDVALAILIDGKEVVLGPMAAIIPLADGFEPTVGSIGIVSGWGVSIVDSGSLSENLMVAEIPVIDYDLCKIEYPFLTPRHICLGGESSPCSGDNGGPAVQNGTLFGVVLGGNNCEANVPAFYIKVSAVRSWIKCVSGV